MNEQGQVIRASFSETEEYLIEALQRHPWKTKTQWVFFGTVAGAAILMGVFLAWLESRKPDGHWWIGPLIAALTLGFVGFQQTPVALRRRIRKEAQQKAGPPAQTAFEFRPDGFTAAERNGKTSFYPWSAIHKVVMHADGFHFYFNERSFFWLPLRAFGNHQDFLTLKEWVRSKVRNIEQAKK